VTGTVHLWLALVVALPAGAIAVLAAGRGLGRPVARRWIDRAVLAALACLGLAIATGLVALATSPTGPRDPLHFLYAVAAPLVLVLARWWAVPMEGQRAWVLAGSGLVAIVLLLRLAQTGG
jgi:hypothetical protein